VSTAANLGFEALKLSGSFMHFSMHELKKFLMFLVSTIKNQTSLKPGEVKLKDLIADCNKKKGSLGIISIDEGIEQEFTQFCKDNSLTYSRLIDVNGQDGRFEVVYNASETQVILFEKFMREHGTQAVPYSFEEYVNNATDERIMEIEKELSAENLVKDFEQAEKSLDGQADKVAESDLNVSEKKEVKPEHESLKIEDKQIVGVTKDICEVTLLDAVGNRYYMDVAVKDMKKTGENEYSVLLDKDKTYTVSSRKGVVKNQDGTFLDVRGGRTDKEVFPCDAAFMRELIDNDKKFRKTDGVPVQGFINSKDPQSNVVKFPTERVAVKNTEIKVSVPKR
jgi:hypothetical protein